MSCAGVPADHAERCLVRHEFSREKRKAFEALAKQIERILDPADNVVALRGGKAG
jgi:hypothetical protein